MPLPYRVLAAPKSGLAMPAIPRREHHVMEVVGYWASLNMFLTYSLGWTRHDRGLMGWYDAGKPTDDPRFALILRVWERDGMLERYLEWSCTKPSQMGPLNELTRQFDSTPLKLSTDWQRRFSQIRIEQAAENSVATTADGKHLETTIHTAGPILTGPQREQKLSEMIVADSERRRAVFISDTAYGWYADLANQGGELQGDSNRSWYIDVFVRTIGFLGTYRRSRQTGLWFSGQHRYHSVGN